VIPRRCSKRSRRSPDATGVLGIDDSRGCFGVGWAARITRGCIAFIENTGSKGPSGADTAFPDAQSPDDGARTNAGRLTSCKTAR